MKATADAARGAPSALVTGAGGFVGRRLAVHLAKRLPDLRLHLTGLETGSDDPERLDVADAAAVETWVKARRPNVVIHLAAVAAVTAAAGDPRLAWRVNLEGTLNLVLALQAHAPEAHLLFVSSAEVYGASLNAPAPVDETALLQPLNPYAASKAAADILVRQAGAAGLPVTVVRPFNHTGAGQSEAFVAPNFAAQIARIEVGRAGPVISVGSLDEVRDFLDVEDVVAAYVAALETREARPSGETFNVASGQAVRVGDLLDMLLSRARAPIEVRVDPARLRKAPSPRAVGDASLLRRRLGWAPTTPLQDTLDALLAHHRRLAADCA